ncbi:hypothetical protein GCM10022226_70470 [Sphaerisporangium flaviroseum]|uniref:Lantibiotic n=1 Tax=Sphaerisporangium flaviroseum TaxID=509199 RepID=A0ABP7J910_9ACTN
MSDDFDLNVNVAKPSGDTMTPAWTSFGTTCWSCGDPSCDHNCWSDGISCGTCTGTGC